MLAMMTMGASWLMVGTLGAVSNSIKIGERERSARALREAKDGFLGWVAKNAADSTEITPGRLPCPEEAAYAGTTNEGIVAVGNNCTLPAVGRLPWRTLGLPKLIDGAGEPLWLIVSSGWAPPNSTTRPVINSNTAGNLAVDGQANAAVAVIVAPGGPVTIAPNASQSAAGCIARTQTRTLPPFNYLDFLECHDLASASIRLTVVDNVANAVSNDQMVVITAAEVMAAIEGSVKLRIETDVLPQIQSIYASAQWGASATAPIYPFPARFTNTAGSTFNPEDFRGRRYRDDANTLAHTQGLLPLTRSQGCTGTRCDTGFVYWNTSPITVSKVSGGANITSSNCSATSSTLISCTINYSETCGFFTTCTPDIRVRIQATAPNVGMTMKTLTTAGTTGGAAPSLTAPLQTDGSAAADYSGNLSAAGSFCLFGCTRTGSGTITIPITVFQDHAFLNPADTDAWYWFFWNNWHEVTYYAVAASHTPAGATHNCSTVGDCISVTGLTPSTGHRAVITLAGQSLTRTTRPNASLADFLDGAENANGDRVFEQQTVTKSFNDRFVSLSNY